MTREAKDPVYIKELAQIMETHSLSRIVIGDRGSEVILEKNVTAATPLTASDTLENSLAVLGLDGALTVAANSESVSNDISAVLSVEEIASPMVGVFRTSSSPDQEPYVRIGDMIKKGDVLCILEAMKLMNEIQAEKEGRIVDICANNGDVVEFGQVLFKVDVG